MAKVKRKVSKGRYFVAGIITFLIFFLGITLGMIMDNERLNYLESKNDVQKINYDSLQLQYLYLSYIPEDDGTCPILQVALEDSIAELSESLEDIERYQQDTTINKNEYSLIERKYLLDNLRYWMFSRKLIDVCHEDTVNVLYFFSLEDCEICSNQGTILSYFKTKLEDQLLVFPVNVDLEENEKFIKILRLRYNVTELPSLVVNDKKYSGVISKNELSKIICEQALA